MGTEIQNLQSEVESEKETLGYKNLTHPTLTQVNQNLIEDPILKDFKL